MEIRVSSIFVDDQEHALNFYTEDGPNEGRARTKAGPVTIAVFDDTCGNHIQLVQE